ncbi:MAG: fluoride efflux transporter CrcB [Deltaproteobacteria bacterium]|nr:MAG: fluoride efflux transporter CrcB [Deltaproteobacteria bacterium]
MSQLVALAIAGAVGTLARFGLGRLIAESMGPAFPYDTLAVNALGSLLMGLFAHVLLYHPQIPPHYRVPLTTGLLGAFTTFSTFSLDTVRLLEAGQPGAALANVAANVVLGLVLCSGGLMVGRAWIPTPVMP